MKIRNIILLTIAIVSLCDCSKDTPEEPYSNKDIVEVNAQAALYFHTVFREAENAWAFINSKEYKPDAYESDFLSCSFVFQRRNKYSIGSRASKKKFKRCR